MNQPSLPLAATLAALGDQCLHADADHLLGVTFRLGVRILRSLLQLFLRGQIERKSRVVETASKGRVDRLHLAADDSLDFSRQGPPVKLRGVE